MDIDALLAEINAAVQAADAAALERVINTYAALTAEIQPYINALVNWWKANPDASPAQVQKTSEYNDLIAEVETELADYSAWLAAELKTTAQTDAGLGLSAGIALIAGLTGTASGELTQGDADEVMQIVNEYLSRDGALYEKIKGLSSWGAERVADIIREGVSLGRNPLTVAGEIVEAGLGVPLSDAMRWTRTLQNYSYRWATLSSYEANCIEGWIWWAELDDKVCMSCVSLHGKVFPVSEGIPNDHHNGRCAMLPYIPQATDGFANPNAGQEWFDSLPETSQKELMGAGKLEAYNNGQFEFRQLSATYDNDIFGTMRREATLDELLGV